MRRMSWIVMRWQVCTHAWGIPRLWILLAGIEVDKMGRQATLWFWWGSARGR